MREKNPYLGSIYKVNTDSNGRIKTVEYFSKRGIMLEYIFPKYGKNYWGEDVRASHFYTDAIDVRSKKSKYSKYENGYAPGEYQPLGGIEYFTFYQLKKMKQRGETAAYIEEMAGIVEKFYQGLREGLSHV